MDKTKHPLLFFSTGYFIYIGSAVDTIVHDHHAIQIAISFNDKIEMILPDSTLKHKAIIINSDQPHECRTYNNTFLLINIDPECKIGAGLKKTWLAGQKATALPGVIVEDLLEEIKPLLLDGENRNDIFKSILHFLQKLSHVDENEQLDERIVKVLEMLSRPGYSPIKISDLAEKVYLSPSRLIHLFTEQVGIPIRKYLLWARLLTSLHQIVNTRDITAASLEGGFSDAPHFNRTFKRMFGLNPSVLLKNSQFIQAYPV